MLDKPSNPHGLAQERCVKIVKENYCTIVIALNNYIYYDKTHESEHWELAKS